MKLPDHFTAEPPAQPKPEPLFTCPCCSIPNFSALGLTRHHCRAKPGRARLTLAEIQSALH